MAGITIAVPVFNGGAFLRGALEAIRGQSFGDFEVLIFDNASTDDTAGIAAEMVAQDSRFHYFRQSENKGALANFVDALRAATSPLFAWHAIDDRWDESYLTELHGLLIRHPEADLAVGRIVSADLDGNRLRRTRFPRGAGRLALLFRSHPSWIYGLFRREPLLARVNAVWADYHHPWAWDHLTLFPFLIAGRVVGTDATTFHQVIRRSAESRRARVRTGPDLRVMTELRRRFFCMASRDIAVAPVGGAMRLSLEAALPFYVGKRVYRLRRLLMGRLRARLGGKSASALDERAGFESYF